MSARQSFVPRSASRGSNNADTEHSFADMPPRSEESIVQPQHNRGIQQEPDAALSMSHKNDSEKRSRFAGMFAKNKHAAKPGTGDHQSVTDISFSSTPGRFSGVRRPGVQNSAPLRRSSSPFCAKGSSFAPPSNPGKFARPTSPIHNTAFQRADLTISGLKDAHISTEGVLSGLISASRVGAAPVSSYESIHAGEHGSNKYSALKSQPAILLERIHEDLEPETVNDHEGVLDARRTGTVAPSVRRVKRVIEDVQANGADFSLSDEIEYARKVKRGRTDEFDHELPIVHPEGSNHSEIDRAHSRLQPDLDTDTVRQSSPPIGQPDPGVVDDLSLEGMFVNMDSFLSIETFMGLVHKWSTCSMEEWLQGSEGV